MRIAIIAPIIERIPPLKYGGTERVIHALTEELMRRGNEVTLFASGDSLTTARLSSVYPKHLREMNVKDLYGSNFWTMLNIGHAYARQHEFDIIHDHLEHLSLPTANLSSTPVVMTLHGPLTIKNKKVFEILHKPYLVTISRSQAIPAPGLNYIGNVYHGLDMGLYPYSREHDGYLLFVGRISEDKGVHFAIEVAQNLDLPLIIAAKLDEQDTQYYEEKVKPHLNEKIRWIGEVDQEERNKLMSRALAFLHPANWREPFGLTVIEAMACGCPVVGLRRGSVPELIAHGKTGFVVEDVEEMTEVLTHIDQIKRRDCRRYAIDRFSAARMADEYEAIYEKVLFKTKQSGKTMTHTIPSTPLAIPKQVQKQRIFSKN